MRSDDSDDPKVRDARDSLGEEALRMYLHLGGTVSVPAGEVVGIFDLDNASTSRITRDFLRNAEEEGMVIGVGEDLPKSVVLCCPVGSWQRVYLSPVNSATLLHRWENTRGG